jgi:hypothetical protein
VLTTPSDQISCLIFEGNLSMKVSSGTSYWRKWAQKSFRHDTTWPMQAYAPKLRDVLNSLGRSKLSRASVNYMAATASLRLCGFVGKKATKGLCMVGGRTWTLAFVNCCGLFPCRTRQPLAGIGGRIRRDLLCVQLYNLSSSFNATPSRTKANIHFIHFAFIFSFITFAPI